MAADPPYQTDFPPEEFHALGKRCLRRSAITPSPLCRELPSKWFSAAAQSNEFYHLCGIGLDPQFRVPEERLYYRYEDVIVITADGYENFTDFLPTELDDLEKLVGQGGVLQPFPPLDD